MKKMIYVILAISFFTTVGNTLENESNKEEQHPITKIEKIFDNIVKVKIYDEDINLEQCQAKKAVALEKFKIEYKDMKITDGTCSKTLSYKDIKDINTCNKTFEDMPKYIEVNKEAHLSLKRALCKEKKDAIKVYSYQITAEVGFTDNLSYQLESFFKIVAYIFSLLIIIIMSPFFLINYLIVSFL
jgi:hypothetical protein